MPQATARPQMKSDSERGGVLLRRDALDCSGNCAAAARRGSYDKRQMGTFPLGRPDGFESWSFAQRVFRMKQARLCGSNRDTDDSRCFLHRMFLQLLKLDHLSNCRPQGADRATKNTLPFLLDATLLGVWSVIRHLPRRRLRIGIGGTF